MIQAGWSKQDIGIRPQGYAMHGYGAWGQRATGQRTPLYARAIVIRDAQQRSLIFCCLDLGYVTYAMRSGVCERLSKALGVGFDESALVLTCTHTHSGPGGCTHDALYNFVTPGFVPEHLERVVDATTEAILTAWRSLGPAELGLSRGRFEDAVEVAWNRSLRAHNRNPEVQPRSDTETHLALDRNMHLLSLRRGGKVQALISLFGVHATCIGNSLHLHDGDNKGYAAAQAELFLEAAGAVDAVAIFAQATAGDVSPHFHGPGQWTRRKRIRGEAEYAYAEANGRHQSSHALALLRQSQERPVDGGIDAILSYCDFTAIHADPAYAGGEPEAWTSEPCHGVAFFVGTPVDGLGMPKFLGLIAGHIAKHIKQLRLWKQNRYPPEEQAYYRRLYAAQGPKAILMEAGTKRVLGQALDRVGLPGWVDPLVGEMKRQARRGAVKDSALVPTVLPLQIVVIGTLALVCCPGEFTTVAGERLRSLVEQRLRGRGVAQVLICTYCNDYMGYVTTQEEYQQQAYEGGHTIYGQWTLAAFQTRFAALAGELLKPENQRGHDRLTRPKPAPAGELALRSGLNPSKSA
jgi:neutral ceramidase